MRRLSTFKRPALARWSLRLIGFLVFVILVGSMIEYPPSPWSREYVFLISLVLLSFYGLVNSYLIGLKPKPTGFVYHGHFVRKKIPYESVSHFRVIDEDEDKWWDLSRMLAPDFLGVPGIVLKDGQFISLPACINWQLRVDKKIRLINQVVAPTIVSTGEPDDPSLSDLGHLRAHLQEWKRNRRR